MCVAIACVAATCGPQALAIMPGVVNNPANRSLRRAIFGFATSSLCDEVKQRSLPLKLRDADPIIGRFFPTGCAVQEMTNENLFVQFSGHGYAWTNITRRIGFTASAAVEYDHDFLMDGSRMYVYFRQQRTQDTRFEVTMVEGQAAGGAVDFATGLLGTSVEQTTRAMGARILESQIARGFTVVRESDGTASFALGTLQLGQMPPKPFDKGDSSWALLDNDRTEIHVGQRDYAGPYTIDDDGLALALTAVVEGAPAVDVLVVPRLVADPWILAYEQQAAAPPPPWPPGAQGAAAAVFERVIEPAAAVPGQRPIPWRQLVPLPKGSYYVVFDHTSSAGQTQPPAQPLDDRAALVSFGVQIGGAP